MHKDLERLYSENTKNQSLHHCDISDADYIRIQPKIELLNQLADIEGSIYAVYDMHKGNYLLQSKEQKRIFGILDDTIEIDTELHYKSIHPDDLPFVLETDNLLYKFFSKLPFEEKTNYKLVYDFRTKNTDGNYVRHMHQSVVFEKSRNGKTWLTLVISHPMAENRTYIKPQRRLINMNSGELHLFNDIDNLHSKSILTKRETDVLDLIARGYDSINISDKLHISINTVNNHRQHILRKTQTENTTQALLYCKRLGIL